MKGSSIKMKATFKGKLRFICLVAGAFAGCKKDDDTAAESNSAESVTPKTVAIVFSAQATDAQRAIADGFIGLFSSAGYTVSIRDDAAPDGDEGYTVLVGSVAKELSQQHLAELGKCGWGVKADGSTLSLCATADSLLEIAAERVELAGIDAEAPFSRISSENAVYNELIYAIKDSSMSMTVSGNTQIGGVSKALSSLTASLSSLIKKQVSSENGEDGDIVLVSPETAKQRGVSTVFRYNEYAIATKDGKIYLYSCNSSGYALAVERLIKIMRDVSDYKNSRALFYPAELTVFGEIDAGVPAMPQIAGGEVYDVALSGSYTVALNGEKQTFLDYAETVAAQGYTLADERSKEVKYMNDTATYTNLFRTYVNDEYMIYMYFMDHDNRIRIVGSNISEYNELKDCTATDGGVESKFTMLNIGKENESPSASGMAFAIRLSDGRFIVIDGGIWGSEDTKAREVVRLYNYLAENSENGEIRIAAWIFTHVHVDHVNVAWKFEQMYGKKVTIERYMHNFVEYDYLLSVENTDLKKDTYDIIYPRMTELLSRYDNAIFHTGQIYNIGNASIEVIYTHEDFYPNPLSIVNNSSTIMRITVEGSTILIGGDAEEDAQQVALENNGYGLTSDFVQMTHHGYNGLRNFYRYAEGGTFTVALCPKNVGSSYTDIAANRWLVENSDEFYIASSGVKEFILPYKGKGK